MCTVPRQNYGNKWCKFLPYGWRRWRSSPKIKVLSLSIFYVIYVFFGFPLSSFLVLLFCFLGFKPDSPMVQSVGPVSLQSSATAQPTYKVVVLSQVQIVYRGAKSIPNHSGKLQNDSNLLWILQKRRRRRAAVKRSKSKRCFALMLAVSVPGQSPAGARAERKFCLLNMQPLIC